MPWCTGPLAWHRTHFAPCAVQEGPGTQELRGPPQELVHELAPLSLPPRRAGLWAGTNSLKWGETWKHGAHTSDRSLSESACMPASSWSPPKPWGGPSMCLQGRIAGCQGAASGIRSACASAVTAATAAAATATAAADPTALLPHPPASAAALATYRSCKAQLPRRPAGLSLLQPTVLPRTGARPCPAGAAVTMPRTITAHPMLAAKTNVEGLGASLQATHVQHCSCHNLRGLCKPAAAAAGGGWAGGSNNSSS
jgi:hypothetical protein